MWCGVVWCGVVWCGVSDGVARAHVTTTRHPFLVTYYSHSQIKFNFRLALSTPRSPYFGDDSQFDACLLPL